MTNSKKIQNLELIIIFLAILLPLLFLINNKYNSIIAQNDILFEEIELEKDPQEIIPKKIEIDEAIESIDSEELEGIVKLLASDSFEGRMSGKKGDEKTANFVEKYFKKYNLKTERQRFPIRRINNGPNNETGNAYTENVYAWIEGENKDEIVVVGAHMDHIGYGPSMSRSRSRNKIHPGADDNASGTACLLLIAKALSQLTDKLEKTVVFQAYSAEEMGLIGSRYYCKNPTFPKNDPDINKHIFMLNMDMVGYLGKGKFSAGFSSGNSSIDIKELIDSLNSKYSFAQKITGTRSGGSDHANFYNEKIPVAFLHTGGHPYYHTPQDTADKLNYQGMEDIAKYATEFVYEISKSKIQPVFNFTDFSPMSLTHDHGIQEFHNHENRIHN